MKQNKMTIYMLSPRQRIWGAIFSLVMLLGCTTIIIVMLTGGIEFFWEPFLCAIVVDITFVLILLSMFLSKLVLEEEEGFLKIYTIGVRKIPLQKVIHVERGDILWGYRRNRYCMVKVKCEGDEEYSLQLSLPWIGHKKWIEYTDKELNELNQRITDWYRAYRKKNKKRKSENETVCRGEPKKGSKHWNHVNDELKHLKRRIKELKKKKQHEKE